MDKKDAVINALREYWCAFENAERVDLVPVVRCKDCKYSDGGTDEDGKLFFKCLGWVYGGTREDDFCSHGERKETTMRLIDADELKKRAFGKRNGLVHTSDIDAAPTVDAVPVRHGTWKTVEDWDGDEHYQCSVCDAEFVLIDGTPNDNDYLYCPHCGASMRGDHHD